MRTLVSIIASVCTFGLVSIVPYPYHATLRDDEQPKDFYGHLCKAAITLTFTKVQYDPAYVQIPFPNGDVPQNKGVCADVVIRAYRKLGIDLQKEVHNDISKNFMKYPRKWGLAKPDKNIDHRRVLNLMTFFERKGTVKPITDNAKDYIPGDIVSWELQNGKYTHIGIVVNVRSLDSKRYMIVHNIGAGQIMEDCLFRFKIIGHYRYEQK